MNMSKQVRNAWTKEITELKDMLTKLERENAELKSMIYELMPYTNGCMIRNRAEALVAGKGGKGK